MDKERKIAELKQKAEQEEAAVKKFEDSAEQHEKKAREFKKKIAKTVVICTQCSAEFPSPIAFGDRKSFETSILSGNTTTCPNCSSIIPCNKDNMRFIE